MKELTDLNLKEKRKEKRKQKFVAKAKLNNKQKKGTKKQFLAEAADLPHISDWVKCDFCKKDSHSYEMIERQDTDKMGIEKLMKICPRCDRKIAPMIKEKIC